MTRLKIAAQVYSLRDMAQADFPGTMKALKECGYEGVELAGLYGLSPEDIRDCLKQEGLAPVSAHVPLEEFLRDMEGTAKAYQTIGCSYIGIPWMSRERHCGGEMYRETCDFLRKLAEVLREKGMTLLYHNHDFEFQSTPEGTCLLDALFGALDEKTLQTELDLCWVKVAGAEPVKYLEKYKDRCPVVHMKDFRREGGTVNLMALGQGEQDIESLVKAAEDFGAKWLVVEQDDHPFGTPLENMKQSIQCLKR